MFNSLFAIRRAGFKGFLPIRVLQESRCSEVPDCPGVYLVLNGSRVAPRFLSVGTGGYFKGRNPNVSLERLKQEWVENTLVLNIGKAGPSVAATLRNRLNLYMRFGHTEAVGHFGGRLIWQLEFSQDLQICWKPVSAENVPRIVERELILNFEKRYKRLPFANLRH